ncbi:dipeptide/oligopeptide/nickel ABC transporter permease/ATP-binding protein [Demequina sp. SYSU T00068]|uniref:dipeptide/oligopeptide/nickel ABC transporter permease/ATP-binding protein n=1 Tax=Demequina lignilytica TaxID=3051663 RepID=UPI00263458DB|nr:dipeptide/oligopeptide/nickel ABC transporter permease/ATP-binding protein [Demequina sp. SYSU T00068]MDN4491638.1 dipeptide/oligopeptide/nickel ABC transporter permease/ATP-binding protein [Demequina sp. SYSU T00068]
MSDSANVSLQAAESASHRSHLVKRMLKNPTGLVSIIILAVIILAATFAGVLATHDPNYADLRNLLQPPGGEFILGTDGAGHDIWSRLLYASRFSLLGAALATVIAAILGVSSGLIAGFYGRWFESLFAWTTSLLMALPGIVVLLAARSVLGPSMWIAMTVFGVLLTPAFSRLTHAAVVGVRNELYVDAARVAGVKDLSIIGRHILSVVRAPVIIQSAIVAIIAIAIQAGLGFIGMLDQSTPNWGSMLNDAFSKMYVAPIQLLWPSAAIALTAVGLALFANTLRDELERSAKPKKLKGKAKAAADAAIDTSGDAPIVHPEADAIDAPVLLDVSGLVVGYDQPDGSLTQVVNGVSLAVRKGEVHGLIGESGSGKTQTAFSILGLLPEGGRVAAGSIVFDGEKLADKSAKAMRKLQGRRISYVPQEPMSNLDPSFPIGSQLVEPMRITLGISAKEAKQRALELLAKVGLPDPEKTFRSYPHEVSGGQAQRVLIAGAISCEPDLIIADEPTTALDVTVQADILDLLRGLQQELGVAVLIVTHNFGVVADLCDRVSVMKGGRIVETGPARSIFAGPQHPYTQSLFDAILEDGAARGALAHSSDRHTATGGAQ